MAIETGNENQRAQGLRTISASRLFQSNVTRLAVRRGAYLRAYTYDFIQKFAPSLSREEIRAALIEQET